MPQESVSACQSCGASIYPEHLDSGIAGYAGGKLLCPHCYSEDSKSVAAAPISVSDEESYEPIELIDDPSADTTDTGDTGFGTSAGRTGIHGFSGDTLSAAASAAQLQPVDWQSQEPAYSFSNVAGAGRKTSIRAGPPIPGYTNTTARTNTTAGSTCGFSER